MNYVVAGLILLGSALSLLGAVGVFRMPDIYSRMQTSTKAGTLGTALLLLGVALYYERLAVTTTAVLIVAFLGLTLPVAAHVIGRAAYRAGAPLWRGERSETAAPKMHVSTERS